jgi:hypothetical protein
MFFDPFTTFYGVSKSKALPEPGAILPWRRRWPCAAGLGSAETKRPASFDAGLAVVSSASRDQGAMVIDEKFWNQFWA